MRKRTPLSAHDAALKTRFGATVRIYRQRLGVSQEELAWRADMHRTYLADVERGARNLSLTSMTRLVSAIGVSLSGFFATLEEVPVPPASAGKARSSAKHKARARPMRTSADRPRH